MDFNLIPTRFNIQGNVISISPYGSGHINTTYLVVTDKKRYILQKMNQNVFPDYKGLMNNIVIVTSYLKERGIETLNVIYTLNNLPYFYDEDSKECYRMYDFIENTVSYDLPENEEMLKDVGTAFGSFMNELADLDTSNLIYPIKDFHNTPKRFGNFLKAYNLDKLGRKASCQKECDYVLKMKDTYSLVMDGLKDLSIKTRVTHNDTKLNNILLDKDTIKPRAIIDLDTIMPGSMLFDFGDTIRFSASTAAEDEKYLDKVHFDISLFEAYTKGYVSAVKDSITKKELELIPYGCYLMTIECGMRFLTDYLEGDTYFKIKYPVHNLVRARTQLKLASEMYSSFAKMKEIVNKY
jgi:N-acetylhexosamine 1-kinase